MLPKKVKNINHILIIDNYKQVDKSCLKVAQECGLIGDKEATKDDQWCEEKIEHCTNQNIPVYSKKDSIEVMLATPYKYNTNSSPV